MNTPQMHAPEMPDLRDAAGRMRKKARKAYVEGRVELARRTASRPEFDSKRSMIAGGAAGAAGAAASMILGKAARRRMQEEDTEAADTAPRYRVPPPNVNGRGAAPEAPVDDASVAAGKRR
jgi:hypothetical protein